MTGTGRKLLLASFSRLGVLLVSDQLSESDAEEGGVTEEGVVTSAQLIRLFNYLLQHKSAREALRWLYQVTGTPTTWCTVMIGCSSL